MPRVFVTVAALCMFWPGAVFAQAPCNKTPVVELEAPDGATVDVPVVLKGAVRPGTGQPTCQIVGWALHVGDGTIEQGTSQKVEVTHTYTVPGVVTVTLSAVDRSGQQAAAFFVLRVAEPKAPDPPPPPPALTLTLPADVSVESSDGDPVLVEFELPVAAGGVPPYHVACEPASGDPFPVGGTTVACGAADSANQHAMGSFSVVVTYTPPPPPPAQAVASFTLINAETNQPIAGFDPMLPGDDGMVELDLQTLPTRLLNIRANTQPETVGSVRFGLDGNAGYRTETVAPYALAGDTPQPDGSTDYAAWTPAVGDHVVTATTFTGPNASGDAGVSLMLEFRVLDAAAPPPPPPTPPPPPPTSLNLRNEDAIHAREMAYLEGLFSAASATLTAAQSGNWSDVKTWDAGRLPAASDRVRIPADVTVTVDTQDAVASLVRYEGTLRFSTGAASRLTAEHVYGAPSGAEHGHGLAGRLEMGTSREPIPANVTAELVLTSDGQPINHMQDPLEFGRGLVTMGIVSIHGAEKTPWVALPVNHDLPGGAVTVSLRMAPEGWQPGDTVVVTGSFYGQSEERRIATIEGTSLTLDKPLTHARTVPKQADGKPYPESYNFSLHVGNLTRNAVVRSAAQYAGHAKHQGHVMLMVGGNQIRYAEFADLGRTLTSPPVTDPFIGPNNVRDPSLTPDCGMSVENVRGRYALHFHMNAAPWTLSVVEGSSIHVKRDTLFKFGFINHSSNVDARDNVTVNIDGSHFMLEEGDEIGEWSGNLAVHSRGTNISNVDQPRNICLQNHADPNYQTILNRRRMDQGHEGNGFWFQGGGVVSRGNVAVGHGEAGYNLTAIGLPLGPNTFSVKMFTANLPAHAGGPNAAWAKGRNFIDIDQIPFLSEGDLAYAGGPSGRRHDSGGGYKFENQTLHQRDDFPQAPKTLVKNFTAWNMRAGIEASYFGWAVLEGLKLFAHPNPGSVSGYNNLHIAVETDRQQGKVHTLKDAIMRGFADIGGCFRLGFESEAINVDCKTR